MVQRKPETSQTGVWPGKPDDDDKLNQVERVSYTVKNYKLGTLHAHSAHRGSEILNVFVQVCGFPALISRS